MRKERRPSRRERQVRFEQALELQPGLVVEGDVIDGIEPDPGRLQAERDGVGRKTGIVLPAREALFLRGGGDAAVLDERGGTIVIEGGQSENSHADG